MRAALGKLPRQQSKIAAQRYLLQEQRAGAVPAAFTPAFPLAFMLFCLPASKRSSSSLVVAGQVGVEQLSILGQPPPGQHQTPPANPKLASSGRGESDSLKRRRRLRGCTPPRRGCRRKESHPINVSPVYVVCMAAVCRIAPPRTPLFAG